ncbi:MAG: Putative pre-16S rRNA nuclease Yqg [Candidatus Bipolaricaulis sibiricus]|uniref:Putative pre-16S rRNA nuclease n=1 Tax=Bipolaricaulis sibiricus TaxID=2501609 RepID=A0A410FSF9_BIPS1|nr:MAG: Putative pre-16S rRNA nuclease Yqg [Candidatus Bipolaricaulis sibiricus]
MRVLGLDIGDRRVGIALSDETGTIASPHGVYTRRSPGEDVHHLAQLAREAGAVALVVGLPLHMDGTEGEQVAKTRALAEAVARDAGLPVHYVDERLTSSEADRAMVEGGLSRRARRERSDTLSAVLILQAWLDRATRT